MNYGIFILGVAYLFDLGFCSNFCRRNPGGLTPNPKEIERNAAGVGEYPWVVGLFRNNKYFCTGSLILPEVVITAAHCTNNIDLENDNITVKAGIWALEHDHPKYPSQIRLVKEIIQHLDFNENNKSNDIAIVFLTESVKLVEYIGIVCLSKTEQLPSSLCFSTGYGNENYHGQLIYHPKNMTLPIIDTLDCEKMLQSTGNLTSKFKLDKKNVICTYDENDRTCYGDGGSPLSCASHDTRQFVLTGIASWGVDCRFDTPNLFTRVSNFVDWINDNVERMGYDSGMYLI